MAINYYLQSKKSPAPVYIRIREGKEIDAKARTEYSVNLEHWNQGEIKLIRMPKGAVAEMKSEVILLNDHLTALEKNLKSLKTKVTNALNNRSSEDVIDSAWLKSLLNPPADTNAIPTTLLGYFDYYIDNKKSTLKISSIRKLEVNKQMVVKFESYTNKSYKVTDVDPQFQIAFEKFCDEKKYGHNTKAKALRTIKTICRHAGMNGGKINPKLDAIKASYKRVESIHLTLDEIEMIINTELTDEKLQVAKDWLIICCFTAQRVSDFMRFRKENIVVMDNMHFIDIRQEKTDTPVYLPIVHPEIINILAKRNGDFPPLWYTNVDSQETKFNELIKEVCRISKIDYLVEGSKKDPITNRNVKGMFKKYKLVSSHIGRRSFASNYYGKINTALLIAATGHSSEKEFLTYVGKKGNHNSLQLARELKALATHHRTPQLTIVKDVVNQ